jgi:Spy/CpxP family protein refolding chaperone
MFRIVLCCTLALLAGPGSASSKSPYSGQESREIKALSHQEVSDYLSGKGMGFAKAAELNGYPGPKHVLELATQLGLTPEQRAKTKALFQKMQARAISLGKDLVQEERALDRLFASRSVTSEALGRSLARIGSLQGKVRQAHLDAHIEQTALLTPEQVEKYTRLRGYGVGPGHDTHEHRHH